MGNAEDKAEQILATARMDMENRGGGKLDHLLIQNELDNLSDEEKREVEDILFKKIEQEGYDYSGMLESDDLTESEKFVSEFSRFTDKPVTFQKRNVSMVESFVKNFTLNELGGVGTSTRHDNGWQTVRYHDTDVFKYNPSTKTLILNNGGWMTNTTKKRMNQAMKEYGIEGDVYQKNYEWFLRLNGQVYDFKQDTLEVKV